MKKTMARIFSLMLVCLLLTSLTVSVSAATVSKVSLTSYQYGGNKTVFYVNAKSTSTTKLNYKCTTGMFVTSQGTLREHEGYFEIKIWGRNSTSESWTYLSKTNIKDVTSKTISMKGYTQYKVQVYAWKTTTIGANIGGICNSGNASWEVAMYKAPTCTFTAKSNVKSLAVT